MHAIKFANLSLEFDIDFPSEDVKTLQLVFLHHPKAGFILNVSAIVLWVVSLIVD